MASLTRQNVQFVTRLKESAEYGVIEQRQVSEERDIHRDEVIVLCAQQEVGPQAQLRRIEVWVDEEQQTMVFLTNNFKLTVSTIAALSVDALQPSARRIGAKETTETIADNNKVCLICLIEPFLILS